MSKREPTLLAESPRGSKTKTIMAENDPAKVEPTQQEPTIAAKFARALRSPAMVVLLLASLALLILVFLNRASIERAFGKDSGHEEKLAKFVPPEEGSWRFIASGDSRNCGDVVMPAIAADSAARYQPSFYWHLGDLRAIYKVDEDMAYAELKNGRYLGCENYVKRAWPDFIENQIAPFGSTPFYVGIGNHEVVPPKSKRPKEDEVVPPEIRGAQFTTQFKDWLLAPAVEKQQTEDCKAADALAAKGTTSAKAGCVKEARNYYHWIQGGVDFIYLDNASDLFGTTQRDWLTAILQFAADDENVRSVVVGMHEALPGSISADHAMCDVTKKHDAAWTASCNDGEQVYKALLDFQKKYPNKPVYILASHSHYYMEGIFNSRAEPEHLKGWIVGTAGAVRYSLPKDKSKSIGPRTNVYGYLLGTVNKHGEIKFEFQEVKEEDVPPPVWRRYQRTFVDWCFAHNSQDIDPNAVETTTRCPEPKAEAAPAPANGPAQSKTPAPAAKNKKP